MTRYVWVFMTCLLWSAAINAATAEDRKHTTAKPAAAPATVVPDDYKLTMLIRTTLIALNQANATGNYSVLRDMAAPDFQQANSQAKLADIFANLRAKNVDLSPILFFAPQLVRKPAIELSGLLRLTGRIETKPEQVNFDLAFQEIDHNWRLYGIAVELRGQDQPNQPAQTSKSSSTGAQTTPPEPKSTHDAPARKARKSP